MFTLAAYFQDVDAGGADVLLDAVSDQSMFSEGKVLRVPPNRAMLAAEALYTVAATRNYAKVVTPSIRTLSNQFLPVIANTAVPDGDIAVNYHPMSPRELRVAEQMQFLVNTDDAAAQDHYGLVWLADGPLQPVTGQIFTSRLTATIQQVAGEWQAESMVFDEQLPVTDYQVVGMRTEVTDGVAARLIFSNSEFRPGAPVSGSTDDFTLNRFRYGALGVWGAFDINQPPRLEVLGGVGTDQTVYLDLIRTG